MSQDTPPTPLPWHVGHDNRVESVEQERNTATGEQRHLRVAEVHGRTPAERRANAELIVRAANACDALAEVCRRYEAWEAAIILSQEAWRGGLSEYPTLTTELWDDLLEIQALRNAALALARSDG